jgi:hypothetical protein
LLIYVIRNRWGDAITISNQAISIEKDGKQRIKIAYSSIKRAILNKDKDSFSLLCESRFLFVAKEGFSDSTWNQLMQCMETSLSAAGVKLSASGTTDMTQQNSGFTAANARVSLSAGCVLGALILLFHYFILVPTNSSLPYQGYRLKTVVMLYELVGGVGLLVLFALFSAGALIFALQARKALSAVRDEIGLDALDALKLEMARSKARKGLIGSMPAHLESVATFRAQRRRLKVLLYLFVGVFSCIGIAGYFGSLH